MPALSRETALKADDLPRERVDVPEWGEGAYVYVRPLTATERDSWEMYAVEMRGRWKSESVFPGLRASLIVRCAVDDDGNRIFLDTDVDQLGDKSGKALDRIWEVATRLNGMTAKDVEDLKKN